MLESFIGRRRSLAVLTFSLAFLTSTVSVFGKQQPVAAGQKGGAPAETKAADSAAARVQAKAKAWSLKMSASAPHTFTLKAKDAPLGEITAELSRSLKVPITVSPLLQKQKVSIDFGGLNLEATLRMLAPQSFVDYVAGGDDSGQPKALAIYLQGFNENPPELTATVKGMSEAILIEGDTEEGTDEEAQRKRDKEDPLRVTFANNQLSVRARKQPLTVVLFKIASEVGVPFELRYESPQIIDVEFNNYSLDQAVRSLSPEVRFYYRLDLQNFQVRPLRLAIVSPAAAKS